MPNPRRPLTAALIAVSAAVQPAIAQQAGLLEEVIVTAEKRATTIQDTPLAVTAFSGTELDRALINKPLDMQFNVPNMLMSKGNFTTANISIRGIGNLGVGSAADSGTGNHFNGVYLNNGRIFEQEFYDAERVEVLRGPQGTLYGRNTTAGVINMITRKPGEDFSGDLAVELGNYQHLKVKGALNLPLSEHWAQRFSLFHLQRDGFVDNLYNGNDVDGRDMYALRSSTRWAGERADATLVINYFEEDSTRMRGSTQKCLRDPDGVIGCLPTGLANESVHGAATVTGFLVNNFVGAVLGQDFPDDEYVNSPRASDPRKQYLDFDPVYEVEDLIVSLEGNVDIGDLTLTGLLGYHRSDLNARNDYDFTVASEGWPLTVETDLGPDGVIVVDRQYASDRSTTEPEQYSMELRLASDFEGDWNFLLGGFWLDYEDDTHYYIYSSALELYGDTLGIAEEQQIFDNDSSDFTLKTWALFGELYWQAAEDLAVTLGLRYTEEEKRARQRTVYLDFLNDPNLPGGDYDKFEGDWSEPTGKLNVTWDLSDAVMAYATLSRSYKSGGFNPISAESPILVENPGLADFDPEYINALELGAKTRLLDNTLQANMTWFYYDYVDLQIAKISNQTSLNENYDATIQGFEGEFLWAPDERWRLSANVAWLDTEIGSGTNLDVADINTRGTTEGIVNAVNANIYLGPDCPGGVIPCAGIEKPLRGNQLPNAPEFSINLGIAYEWPLDNGWRLTAASNYYWQDEFYSRVFNTRNDTIEAWDVWNATLSLFPADQRWFAELWGRNLSDDDHVTGQYLGDQAVGLTTNQFLLEPRTYGLTVGYTF